jgi:hypothetical protein
LQKLDAQNKDITNKALSKCPKREEGGELIRMVAKSQKEPFRELKYTRTHPPVNSTR